MSAEAQAQVHNEAIDVMYMTVSDEQLTYMQAASQLQPGISLIPVTDVEGVSAEGTLEDEEKLKERVQIDLNNGLQVVRVEASAPAVPANTQNTPRNAEAQRTMDYFLNEVDTQQTKAKPGLFLGLPHLAHLALKDVIIGLRKY